MCYKWANPVTILHVCIKISAHYKCNKRKDSAIEPPSRNISALLMDAARSVGYCIFAANKSILLTHMAVTRSQVQRCLNYLKNTVSDKSFTLTKHHSPQKDESRWSKPFLRIRTQQRIFGKNHRQLQTRGHVDSFVVALHLRRFCARAVL